MVVRPRLPHVVANALQRQPYTRHPALAQGILYGNWPGQQDDEEQTNKQWKSVEADRQSRNLSQFFAHYHQPARNAWNRIIQRQAGLGVEMPVQQANASVSYRLVVGFGLPNQLDTNLIMHPLYGVPYLPGTSIKGVTQAYLLQAWAAEAGISRLSMAQRDEWNAQPNPPPVPLARFETLLMVADSDQAWAKEMNEIDGVLTTWAGLASTDQAAAASALASWGAWKGQTAHQQRGETYIALFGSPGQQGRVAFLDAFPFQLSSLADVLTPHAGAYYGNPASTAPSDDQSPVPVSFIALKQGTQFKVMTLALDPEAAPYATFALDIVRDALRYQGIGAKTSSGYGTLI